MNILNTKNKVAVCSRSFSRNQELRDCLLSRYQNVSFNDKGLNFSGESLVNFLHGHDKAIIALEVIDDAILSQLPDLKVIGKFGVGLIYKRIGVVTTAPSLKSIKMSLCGAKAKIAVYRNNDWVKPKPPVKPPVKPTKPTKE